MEDYKGYRIELNQYYSPSYESTKFIFYNTLDFEIPIGTGKDIEDCKNQIDEKLTE